MANPIFFERQRHLLLLLDALGGRVKNLDFQKLLFLYCQEQIGAKLYEFVPYRFGAFSFTSYADRRKLMEREFLADNEHNWLLTDLGRLTVKLEQEENQPLFVRRLPAVRGDLLVAETYRRYPYFAIRSEIAERVLDGDDVTLRKIEAARPLPRPSGISTIGYEGRTIENFLNKLLRSGVTLLCDVRRNPVSRKYGFSKSTLANGCKGVGIRYKHLPELGIAQAQRRKLKTQADYDVLFENYEKETLPRQGRALMKINEWARAGEHVALTCYERLPQQCHRHCVAEAIEYKFGPRISTQHF